VTDSCCLRGCPRCLCRCGRGLTNTPGGKCMRCRVAGMAPGLAKMIATALLPVTNSDLPKDMANGEVWPAGRSAATGGLTAADSSEPGWDGAPAPAADMEIGG
jgi:hypothetical protein